MTPPIPRRPMMAALLALLALLALPLATAPARAETVTVFAAASLKNALDAAAAAYRAKSGGDVTISYAGSSQLAKQIEAGAPADIFFSADLDWMDYLQKRELIDTASRVTLLGNRLVLVAPKASTVAITIAPDFPLAAALGAEGKLAMANVDSVPAGKYGKATLTALGVWDAVSAKVAQADNVRAALAFVSRGEAPLGIVYETDAHADAGVKIVGTFPETSHPKIVYPVARLAASKNADAKAFLDFLVSPPARPIFEREGFAVIGSQG